MINSANPIKYASLFFSIFVLLPSLCFAEPKISELIITKKGIPLEQRIINLSAAFLNVPYHLEPLGEGLDGKYNQNPLYRFDQFDCETYVDTVMALALANDENNFKNTINQIRYKKGLVDFTARNHFTSADWIASNSKNYFISDLTARIAGNETRESHVFINRKNWYQHLPIERIQIPGLTDQQRQEKLQQLHAEYQTVKNNMAVIDYIPLKLLLTKNDAILKKIPNGAVIFLVVKDPSLNRKIGTQNNISHMGFAIWKDNQLYLRAASSLHQHVMDAPLLPYLGSQGRTLLGISVWEVVNNGEVSI